MSRFLLAIVMSVTLMVAACGGGGGGGGGGGDPVLLTVGGSISGLAGSGLVLANGGDTRSVSAGATSFTLPTALAAGSSFNVVVQTQPVGQTCVVSGGSGTMGATNVTSVTVTCSANTFTLGGSISGLTASGLVLANGSDTLTVAAGASAFTFPTALTSGSRYDIAVNTQPAGLTCSVASGSGVVGNANVNNAVVTCSTSAFTLGGSIGGLTTSGLVLANGADTVAVQAGASSFAFPGLVALGGGFNVTVKNQPVGQICSVSGGSGTMGAADVTSVLVACSTDAFTVGGTISGLTSEGLILASDSNAIAVAANASSFTLPAPLASGGRFNVTVQAQPLGLTCTVVNGSAIVGASNVTSVVVTCSADAFTVGGSISGLISSGLVLANGSDTLLVAANDSRFTLPTPVASGSSFEVLVQTPPSGLTCTVANGNGTMRSANVTSVAVTCSPAAFTLGGSISGLTSSGLVLANGSDTLAVAANASSFSMPVAVAFGSPFDVTVQTQAEADTCGVSKGSGTMGGAEVTSVLVDCVPATFAVSTLAGSDTFGSADGSGTAASFSFPFGVAVDRSGTVYVADTGNHKIRKITAAGVVSTFAGSGADGSADGIGTAASFNFPFGVAVDSSGNVYVADTNNNTIRKITAAGVVSTFAGSGTAGSADGSGTAASFNRPQGVAVDGSGTVYVSDTSNHTIRKITAAGVVSTLAGSGTRGSADGSGTEASFNNPGGVAVDSSGTVYVADDINNKIRKITAAGVVSTLAGSGTAGSADGSGTAASFNSPRGVAVDSSGTVYVADTTNRKIRKITAAGVVSTVAGSGTAGSADGSGTTASFAFPQGVAVDSSGTLYVGDQVPKIRKITRDLPSPFTVSTLAGSGTRGSADGSGTAASFALPQGAAVDSSGTVYVADTTNHTIRKITAAGVVSTFAGSGTAGSADGSGTAASFNNPNGVAVDSDGNVYVADTINNKIRKITAAGVVSTFAGSGAAGSADGSGAAASFTFPLGVAVDGSGTVYVADSNNTIRKITPAGVVSTLAGSGSEGSADGSGTEASFDTPSGVGVDSSGTVYVADSNNHKIRKITAAGVVSTFAGSGTEGSADGSGTAASFNTPSGVAVDGSGNVYVADLNNHKIRKITAAGVVSTLAGSGAIGSADGSGTLASFNRPRCIAIDSSGTLYVGGQDRKIRKITRD